LVERNSVKSEWPKCLLPVVDDGDVMSGVRIKRDEVTPHLTVFDAQAVEAIHLVLKFWVAQAMNMMKTGARWTDRTGNARAGLMAADYPDGDGGSLVLWSAASYGIWLEVRWHGKYAIVGPVMNQIAPRIQKMAAEAVMKTSRPG
jgi:hypothetical protein